MDEQTLIIIAVGAIVLFVFYRVLFVDGRKHEDGRIDGENITQEQLFKILSEFTPQKINKTQVERGIQKELNEVLNDKITLVDREYSLEARAGRNLDFNIGGKKKRFGIELKVVKQLKTAEWDRVQTQLREYLTHYKNDNFILLMFGSKSERKGTIIHEVENYCKKNNVHFIYKNIEYNSE